ncbi:cmgc/cdk/pitslre protein kinase [Xylariaceae sp. FL0804]|nr:cmgc/cdk/pitslre protein kinase [Xylariaceae sp. FL0804]
MAGKSRWADAEADAALDAQRKREKEEKKRLKAEKARQQAAAADEAARRRAQEQEREQQQQKQQEEEDPTADRPPPAKRRRLTPSSSGTQQQQPPNEEPAQGPAAAAADGEASSTGPPPRLLLRLDENAGGFGPARSVECYEKLNDIEEGAYGWVARARERATGRVVALKRLKTEPIVASSAGPGQQLLNTTGLPETGLREIQILRACGAHRNVVGLREVVVGGGGGDNNHEEDGDGDYNTPRLDRSIFLVLDFVEHDLKTVLEELRGPFLASEVKTLLLQLAAGVAHLHACGVLHRDLKTSNLLLSNRGVLRIADFGMARFWSPDWHHHDPSDPSSSTKTSTTSTASESTTIPAAKLTPLVVTLWYRAPELLLGAASYGPAVDAWSVGCVFAELLAREPLLRGANEVDQLARTFELLGVPTDASWPGFRRLPHARTLRLPPSSSSSSTSSSTTSEAKAKGKAAASAHATASLRARFPTLTAAGTALLASLLSLDPAGRPALADLTPDHPYFRQDPRPKHEALLPTFPSRAGRERPRRRRDTPEAPGRDGAGVGAGVDADHNRPADFSGIFAGRDREERGGGFSLRMV